MICLIALDSDWFDDAVKTETLLEVEYLKCMT